MTDQNVYLKMLDIIRWDVKNPPEISVWGKIEQCVKECVSCGLHKTRTQTVFGTGNRNARVMFIGEAPGAEEDKQGKPFVGRAVFIANILKCRPPNNRDPQAEEVEKCTPFLREQIELIKPDVLVALGRIASHFLLDTTTSLSKLRGQVFKFNNTPLLVTYHPAYLLRTPADKSKAYEDLKKIREFL
jgi:uracil-DNA glycosylase family 4